MSAPGVRLQSDTSEEAARPAGGVGLKSDTARALYSVSSASAVTVRQFRTVIVVGRRRFVSASMSFEPALPVRHADVELATGERQLVREVRAEVAQAQVTELDRLAQEDDDELRRVVDRIRARARDLGELLPGSDDDRHVVSGRVGDRTFQLGAEVASAHPVPG